MEEQEKTCETCQHFYRHYVRRSSTKYIPLVCGPLRGPPGPVQDRQDPGLFPICPAEGGDSVETANGQRPPPGAGGGDGKEKGRAKNSLRQGQMERRPLKGTVFSFPA